MHWMVKAAMGQLISLAPNRQRLHYLVQKHVTRTLPMPEREFRIRFDASRMHLDHWARFGDGRPLGECTFFEFGAGWDLAVPIAFAAAGVRRQELYDLTPLVRPELVAVSLARVRAAIGAGDPPYDPSRLPAAGPGEGPEALASWLERLGIRYTAPGDARATGLRADSIDCVTSTATLEHVPPAEIAAIFRELFRVLRPGGVMSCQVDMSDHFSHADASLTPWHFLRFSERAWKLVNSDLLYQNRLRASAYVEMARAAGFEVRQVDATLPGDCDPERLPSPEVHPSYRAYRDQRDLLAAYLQLVCVKPAR